MDFEKEPGGQNAEMSGRERLLEKARAKVENFKDRLENPVDEGIKEALAKFVACGIPTSMSCEGHISDSGSYIPYIMAKAPGEPIWGYKGQKEFFQKIADEHSLTLEEVQRGASDDPERDEEAHRAWKKAYGEMDFDEPFPETTEWKAKEAELRSAMRAHIDEFNATRAADSIRLVFDGLKVRPESEYEDKEELSDDKRKELESLLPKYREAMNEFADFLVSKLLSE